MVYIVIADDIVLFKLFVIKRKGNNNDAVCKNLYFLDFETVQAIRLSICQNCLCQELVKNI